MFSQKVNGFTLIESLLAISLLSICIVVGLYGIESTHVLTLSHFKATQKKADHLQFFLALKHDLIFSNSVTFNSQSITLHHPLNKTLEYRFESEKACRLQDTDRFCIPTASYFLTIAEKTILLTSDLDTLLFSIPKHCSTHVIP